METISNKHSKSRFIEINYFLNHLFIGGFYRSLLKGDCFKRIHLKALIERSNVNLEKMLSFLNAKDYQLLINKIQLLIF